VEAIPGPIERLLDVAPGLWSGAAMGLDEAGPADVEAGGMLAAAFFSAACRIWSLDCQFRMRGEMGGLTREGSSMRSIRPIQHNPHSLFRVFARLASRRLSFL
jgi:hypothetical protein